VSDLGSSHVGAGGPSIGKQSILLMGAGEPPDWTATCCRRASPARRLPGRPGS